MTSRQQDSNRPRGRREAVRILVGTKNQGVRTESKFARSRFLGNHHYELDGLGNREQALRNGMVFDYDMSASQPEPADYQMNQYTASPEDAQYQTSAASDPMYYDRNGNLTQIGDEIPLPKKKCWYDFGNRMAKLQVRTGAVYVYKYDALGRRIAKIQNPGAGQSETRYYYDGYRVIEEQDGNGATVATYVYGDGLDQVVQMVRGGQASYYHSDDLGSVLAVSNGAGTSVESYDYGDFGRVLDGTTLQPFAGSTIGNPFFFTGARRDVESTWYYMRHRYFMPGKARFTSRDPLGAWLDGGVRGSAVAYCGNNPGRFVDRFGLDKLTLYVWQPNPGTPDTHNGVETGHACLEFELSPNGEFAGATITLGFYPEDPTGILPGVSDSGPGILYNDAARVAKGDWSVAYSVDLSKAQVMDAWKEAFHWLIHPPEYDLCKRNCVDFILAVFKAAGIVLPDPQGSWVLGSGSNPGQFGEAVRGVTSLGPGGKMYGSPKAKAAGEAKTVTAEGDGEGDGSDDGVERTLMNDPEINWALWAMSPEYRNATMAPTQTLDVGCRFPMPGMSQSGGGGGGGGGGGLTF